MKKLILLLIICWAVGVAMIASQLDVSASVSLFQIRVIRVHP